MNALNLRSLGGMHRSVAEKSACPGCLSQATIGFYYLADQPVHVGVTYNDARQARLAPCGEINLHFCPDCGLVYNASYDPAKMGFTPGYDASLTASDQFMRFLDSIIERLICRYDLADKTVLEVGCGIGYFLRRLCRRAGCHGIGIDPAVPTEGSEKIGEQTITWVRGLLGPEFSDFTLDLICCLDMFEQVSEPRAFLQSIRSILPGPGGTPVYFELPERGHVFEAGAGWSIYCEQCCYYDIATLRGLFERSGFEVIHAAPFELNPQCVSIEAVAKPIGKRFVAEGYETPDKLPANLAAFDRDQHARTLEWSLKINHWIDTGRDVVLWGSGGKGINFLNTVPGAERISRVVDVNPARQGRYLPRAGQRVVAPTSLVDSSPDVVLVSNRHWHHEIAGTIDELGLDCELLDV